MPPISLLANCDPAFDALPHTARTHSDAQFVQIAASIAELGWTNPILVEGADGTTAGRSPLLAAYKLGMIETPAIDGRT